MFEHAVFVTRDFILLKSIVKYNIYILKLEIV